MWEQSPASPTGAAPVGSTAPGLSQGSTTCGDSPGTSVPQPDQTQISQRLNLMILNNFSNLNDSVELSICLIASYPIKWDKEKWPQVVPREVQARYEETFLHSKAFQAVQGTGGIPISGSAQK